MIQFSILLKFIKSSPENNISGNDLLRSSSEQSFPSTSYSKHYSDQDLKDGQKNTKKLKISFEENNLESENKIKDLKKGTKEEILSLVDNAFQKRYSLNFKELMKFFTTKQGLIDYTNVVDDFSVLLQKINFPLRKPNEETKKLKCDNLLERMNYLFSAFEQYLNHVSKLKKGMGNNQSNYISRFEIKPKSGKNPLISILDDSNLYVYVIMPELHKYHWQCKEKFLIGQSINQLFMAVCLVLIKTFMCARDIHDILIKYPINVYELDVEILKFRTLFFLSISQNLILLAGSYDNFYLLFLTFVETFYPSDFVNPELLFLFSENLSDFFSRYINEKLLESLKYFSESKKIYYCKEFDKLIDKKSKKKFSCIDQNENLFYAVSKYKIFKNNLFENQDFKLKVEGTIEMLKN